MSFPVPASTAKSGNLKLSLSDTPLYIFNKPHVCLYCLGAPKSPQKVSGVTQNLAKMDGGQVSSSVGEFRVMFCR